MTQLLLVIEQWTEMLDSGDALDVVYLDLQKAFNSVPHKRLITKLDAYGIAGAVKCWIQEYLTNRRQRVVANGKFSSWSHVISGIPQGSVLGPILFVIFINDLPDVVGSSIADDTKIFRAVSNDQDKEALQSDIHNLEEWSCTWQLTRGSTPANAMLCTLATDARQLHNGQYNAEHNHGRKGSRCIYDSDLKFRRYVAQTVLKANQILGLIKMTFTCLDKCTLPRLFTALVHPHLEYGNTIWNPRFKLDEQAVEKVQRRATKLVPSIRDLPYTERLRQLELPSLKHRRLRGDLIQVYKILNGIDRLDPTRFFTLATGTSATTRGHSQKIFAS